MTNDNEQGALFELRQAVFSQISDGIVRDLGPQLRMAVAKVMSWCAALVLAQDYNEVPPADAYSAGLLEKVAFGKDAFSVWITDVAIRDGDVVALVVFHCIATEHQQPFSEEKYNATLRWSQADGRLRFDDKLVDEYAEIPEE